MPIRLTDIQISGSSLSNALSGEELKVTGKLNKSAPIRRKPSGRFFAKSGRYRKSSAEVPASAALHPVFTQ